MPVRSAYHVDSKQTNMGYGSNLVSNRPEEGANCNSCFLKKQTKIWKIKENFQCETKTAESISFLSPCAISITIF